MSLTEKLSSEYANSQFELSTKKVCLKIMFFQKTKFEIFTNYFFKWHII
jgi:hypothetical protein